MRNKYDATLKGENGFEYKFLNERFEVGHLLSNPDKIFKYYSNSKYNIDAFINNYFYLSHPFDFNDAMDSHSLLWDFKNLTEKQYSDFYRRYNLSAKEITKKYLIDKANGFSLITTDYWIENSNDVGIVSLTNNPLNILMWAHYAGETGFMVEYDKDNIINEIKSKNLKTLNNYVFYPINYVTALKRIQMPGTYKTADVPFLYSFGTKLKPWDYEEEWRLICFMNNMGIPHSKVSSNRNDNIGNTNRHLYYSSKSIEKIILGMYFINKSFVSQTK